VPGVLASIVIGTAASGRVARALGTRQIVAWLLIVSIGLVLSATLTPVSEFETSAAGVGVCDLTRIGPAPLEDLRSLNDTTLNIVLFLPLGVAVGLLQNSRRKVAIILAVAAMPFVIEGIQLVATSLHRGCESADVSDNLTGLIIGFAVGQGLRLGAGLTLRRESACPRGGR
jgi:VanZ family protein